MSIQSLSDACEIIMGQSPPSDTYNDDGEGLPFYQGKTDFGSLYPVPRKWCNKPQKIAQPNDILISVRAPVGPTNLCNSEACIGRGLAAIRSKYGISDNKYVLFYLRSIAELIESKGTGSTFQAIGRETLSNIQIPLPPLPIQKRIATILEKADAAREKRRQTITLTVKFLQSAFLEMFGDPVTNPKGWEKKKLHECCIGTANNGFFAKSPDYDDSGIPIVWITDFINKFYIQESALRKVRIDKKNVEKYLLKYGDVLFCRSSLTYEGIGKAAIVPKKLTQETIFECHIIRASLDISRVIPEFFRTLSDTKFFRAQIEKNSKTSTMTTIGQDGVVQNTIIVPPVALQQKFAALVEKVEAMLAKQRASEQELENLFQSLMQRAFKGELI